ncbi:M28 family peptidase [Fulvivirga sedimenti]|uniref:M28 family peptidase n=1 Tax=Fulvivirga sedimenti TaxID=2879465 RepID=A0A9X1KXC7_9BACT|nr:M28 family peptidase [Fulvivirga sedimenti]MCA6074839.1 M28 family peptidase [Fulvivirga sedimenti]MCA6076016.1 M28 family peptidase [Fulvivirga sedimenti]MCA6077144.1 M28 family peptidase [Fulvivirga sedimenti]
MRLTAIFLILLISFAGCKDKVLTDEELLAFADKVESDQFRYHVALLADDSMKGRLPGTPEYEKAMGYVVDQFEAFGLEPVGDNGSYLQHLTLRTVRVNPYHSHLLLGSDTLKAGSDYLYMGNANQKQQAVEAGVVFVGYGIEADTFGHNDYAGIDVANKIVLVLLGAPETLPPSERAYFSNLSTKMQTADAKGASGVLLIYPPNGRGSFEGASRRYSESGITNVLMPSGLADGRANLGENLKIAGFYNMESLDRLIPGAMDSLLIKYEQGELLQPGEELILSGSVVSDWQEFESANVLGLLEGTDLKDEYIIHTAHLDHVGIGEPVNGDSIYNGAHDNASGISAMLEIARLYTSMDSKPRRSVIFAAVTAEEMGLLGSKYLARNPPVPKEQVIANVNTDMPTLIAPLLSIEPLGAEHSSIMKHVQTNARLLNLQVNEDHMPEEVRFVRSDNYNFILEGVPALRMKYGLKTEDSETGLDSLINTFTRNVYHKPSDEVDGLFDFEAARTYVKLQFMNSYKISVDDERPKWNEDSFFRKFER